MAVVRELVTVLATQFDSKGVVQYEAAVNRVKELAISVGKVLGIAFSIEKIAEFVDGVIESGQEINKIRKQIENIARPMDNVNEAMGKTFEIAQKIGVAYT